MKDLRILPPHKETKNKVLLVDFIFGNGHKGNVLSTDVWEAGKRVRGKSRLSGCPP